MATTTAVVYVYVTNAASLPFEGAEVEVRAKSDVQLRRDEESTAYVLTGVASGDTVQLVARAPGVQSEPLTVTVRGGIQQVVINMPTDGQLVYWRGDNRIAFQPDWDWYLVFVEGTRAGPVATSVLQDLQLEIKTVPLGGNGDPLQHPQDTAEPSTQREAAYLIRAEPGKAGEVAERLEREAVSVRLARPVRRRPEDVPSGLTGELVCAFQSDVGREDVERIAASFGLKVVRPVLQAGNAFVLVRPGVPDYDVLDVAWRMADDPRVLWWEPNLIVILETDAYTPNDPLFGELSHLALINADDAWERLGSVAANLRGGSPTICIGVVDPYGVAPDHPDLTSTLTDGQGKLITSMDFLATPIGCQTVAGLKGDHGTQCAGSATAGFDDGVGITGVAPNCRLIGAQTGSATNEVLLADLYMWMAGFENGSPAPGFPPLPAQPADIISSSFGKKETELSHTMRTLFTYLTCFGRNGRGTVLCFSPRDNGYGDFTDPSSPDHFRPWPTYERCIGVASSINVDPTNPTTSKYPDPLGATTGIATQVDQRSLFSPYGATAFRKPDLVSPSHTTWAATTGFPPVDPVLSAVRVGTGTVDGCPGGTPCNNYDMFGGNSHATPTVAGAVALILSARPELSWVQVRDLLRQSCVRIDATNPNLVAQWQDLDGDGRVDYSRWYGSGRLDVDAAVALALDPCLALGDAYVRENLSDVGDLPSPGWHAESPDIWVRQLDEPIPALPWSSAPPHQNPVRGVDNYVFCRVRNRGPVAVSTLYLRASITHYPGFEFRYPQEFRPSTNVGYDISSPLVPGTYAIGEIRIDDLGPGEDTIVKMTWPAALIPPATVTVAGVPVTWHPCLLLEASPHDGPAPADGVIAVRGDNNIAQRNITIQDPADPDAWFGVLLASLDQAGVRSLIVDATRTEGDPVAFLRLADPEAMALLRRGARQAFEPMEQPRRPTWRRSPPIVIRESARLLVGGAETESAIEILAPAGTELRWPGEAEGAERSDASRRSTGDASGRSPVANPERVDNVDTVAVRNLPGILEIPLPLRSGRIVPMAVSVRGRWRGELRLTQRRGDGLTSPGYSLRR